jgi:hypothetical protein
MANQTKLNQTKWTQPTPEDETNNEWYLNTTGTNERKSKKNLYLQLIVFRSKWNYRWWWK